ncbi:MAG: hypothetical protein ACRDJN_05195 [Chloroflexota bacterium]
MKALGILVGVIVLLALLGSCAAGYGVSRAGGVGTVTILRDLGIIILAFLSFVMAAIWGAIYFGAAWAVDRFGPKAPAGVRWVGVKVAKAEALAERGTEEGVVRPLAGATRRLTTTATFVKAVGAEGAPASQAAQRWRHELTTWPTLIHRLRGRQPGADGAVAPEARPAPERAMPPAGTQGAREEQEAPVAGVSAR